MSSKRIYFIRAVKSDQIYDYFRLPSLLSSTTYSPYSASVCPWWSCIKKILFFHARLFFSPSLSPSVRFVSFLFLSLRYIVLWIFFPAPQRIRLSLSSSSDPRLLRLHFHYVRWFVFWTDCCYINSLSLLYIISPLVLLPLVHESCLSYGKLFCHNVFGVFGSNNITLMNYILTTDLRILFVVGQIF